jgi:transcriptional regulator with XRE-family HTH domain
MKNPVTIEARKMLVQYLKDLSKEKGITTYRLAELTGMDQPNIQRIFSG